MTTAPPAPAERFATLLRWLGKTIFERYSSGVVSQLVLGLIIGRIQTIRHRLEAFAASLQAGTYRPREFAPRRKAPGRPPPVDPLPNTFGWLIGLVRDTVVYNSHLRILLEDPEIIALLAVAPDSLRRPLRSLCRALALVPPPILAKPKPRPTPPPAPTSPSPPSGEGRGEGRPQAPDRPATRIQAPAKRTRPPKRKIA